MNANDLIEALKRRNVKLFTGTPCSYLKPIINRAIDDEEVDYIDAANEGDAVSIASGAYVGGMRTVVMFQNSGLGNAVNALTSLNWPFRIPVLLIVTHRGQPGGPPDEPQHELMGVITTALLEKIKIPWILLPRSAEGLEGVIDNAFHKMGKDSLPYALVVQKGAVEPYTLKTMPDGFPVGFRSFEHRERLNRSLHERASRPEVLACYLENRRREDVVICTTGYTGRELYALGDSNNHFYMVGSMGSAASFSLGLSLARPERRIVVFDGDGAVLMRMGNLALLGSHPDHSIFHIILDNEAYESTGNQATNSRQVSYAAIAKAAGYREVHATDDPAELASLFQKPLTQTTLVHFKIRSGSLESLARPKIKPFEVKERLRTFLAEGKLDFATYNR
jgi:phosphonopyruvate decarboxylase